MVGREAEVMPNGRRKIFDQIPNFKTAFENEKKHNVLQKLRARDHSIISFLGGRLNLPLSYMIDQNIIFFFLNLSLNYY